jgi:hypothetical protein
MRPALKAPVDFLRQDRRSSRVDVGFYISQHDAKAAVALRIEAANDTIVHGDRDLLFEAIVRVKDTGPGMQ